MRRLLIAIIMGFASSPALTRRRAGGAGTVTMASTTSPHGRPWHRSTRPRGAVFPGLAHQRAGWCDAHHRGQPCCPLPPNAALINCIGCGELAAPADARGFLDEYATAVSVYVGELDNAPDWEPPPGDTSEVALKAYGADGTRSDRPPHVGHRRTAIHPTDRQRPLRPGGDCVLRRCRVRRFRIREADRDRRRRP